MQNSRLAGIQWSIDPESPAIVHLKDHSLRIDYSQGSALISYSKSNLTPSPALPKEPLNKISLSKYLGKD